MFAAENATALNAGNRLEIILKRYVVCNVKTALARARYLSKSRAGAPGVLLIHAYVASTKKLSPFS